MLPAEESRMDQGDIGDMDIGGAEPRLSGVLLLGTLVIVLPYLMLIASFLMLLRWGLE